MDKPNLLLIYLTVAFVFAICFAGYIVLFHYEDEIGQSALEQCGDICSSYNMELKEMLVSTGRYGNICRCLNPITDDIIEYDEFVRFKK